MNELFIHIYVLIHKQVKKIHGEKKIEVIYAFISEINCHWLIYIGESIDLKFINIKNYVILININ